MDLRDGNRNSRRFAVGKGVGRVLFKLFHLETHFLRRHYPDRFNGRRLHQPDLSPCKGPRVVVDEATTGGNGRPSHIPLFRAG